MCATAHNYKGSHWFHQQIFITCIVDATLEDTGISTNESGPCSMEITVPKDRHTLIQSSGFECTFLIAESTLRLRKWIPTGNLTAGKGSEQASPGKVEEQSEGC